MAPIHAATMPRQFVVDICNHLGFNPHHVRCITIDTHTITVTRMEFDEAGQVVVDEEIPPRIDDEGFLVVEPRLVDVVIPVVADGLVLR